MSNDSAGQTGGRIFRELMQELSREILALQQPSELIVLMQYSMSLLSAIRISVEAGIFQHLADSKSPVSVNDLVRKLGVASATEQDTIEQEEFLTRLLRVVTGLKLADEVGPGLYQANELTTTVAHPGFEDGWKFMYDGEMGPHSSLSHTLAWAKDNNYKAPNSGTDGPYQQARGIAGTSTFQYWVEKEPVPLSQLSAWMQRIQLDRLNWSAWFPNEALSFRSGSTSTDDEQAVFMVDVGGGRGHDLNGFAARYPNQKIRLVVQDLPEVIKEARAQDLDTRIEFSEHDFFKPQPVEGAKIYFLHKIAHDWPDRDCVRILTHLRDAMASDSRIFINDAILPDQGSPLLMAAFDMTMMILLSGKERSESMWKRLISEVGGLAIKKFWQAPNLQGEGIVEVIRTS